MRSIGCRLGIAVVLAAMSVGRDASAQQPPFPPQQPLPPQGQLPPPNQGQYPQQPPPGQYPPPGYGQQGQYPPPGYNQPPPGQYPPPGYNQPPPGQYPPPGYNQAPPGQYPPPGYNPMPPPGYPPYGQPPPPSTGSSPDDKRSGNEMLFLYGASIGYGVGTGIWIDALGKVSDPGVAFIAPLLLGGAAPVGVYFADNYAKFHRGVPSSIATGLALGALEGMAISGTQWQYTDHNGPNTWSFATQTTVTWLMATGGAVGGYAFGEWLRPDPRSLGFIASTAGWGAISGSLFGAGVSGRDWKDGASVAGLVGYNAGILVGGALSINYVPSWRTQKYMWGGYALGTAGASVVYIAYLFSDADPKHGLIANSLGGLAGVGIAAALTANMKDDADGKSGAWSPPFQLGFAPLPNGGIAMNASGLW
jgi:hypothetical protein